MQSSHNDGYRVVKAVQHRTLTCDMCKSRHQKCSGDKPACSNCTLRNIVCSYTTRQRIQTEYRSPDTTSARPSISESDYNRLYSEIYGDILRRFNLNKDDASASVAPDVILDARPGNASLSSFNLETVSIVRDYISRGAGPSGPSTSTSLTDIDPFREIAFERSSDAVRKILKNSLPSEEVAIHLLNKFLDHQNSVFYVCSREESTTQLALIYSSDSSVSISWFCQMFLIFAVGGQFDDVYDTDGTTYHELGQKYIDDAIDEHPENTIWLIRAMLLLCIYQPPTKWNSVWMHLDAAIRGAQRFQLDTGQNSLKELPDADFYEYRRLWYTVISFDRCVAIFLGRLPRIKESISKDPIFKDPEFRLECTPQNNVTALAIIAGNILRDMYFSENPSLNVCRQRKSELEAWMSNLENPIQQHIRSGSVPEFPKDQAEVIFNLHFMHLGSWTLVTRPFLCKALKMNTSNKFGGPIESVIMSEANLCIGYASSLISSATLLLGSSLTPKRAVMPLFFLIHSSYIMILAIVWRAKQNSNTPSSPTAFSQNPEITALDSAIQTLEFCAQRNSFARRYLIHIKDLRRQLLLSQSIGTPSTSTTNNFTSPFMASSTSGTDSDPATFRNLAISSEQGGAGFMPDSSGVFADMEGGSNDMNMEAWQFGQFGGGSDYDSLMSPNGYNSNNFWDGPDQ